MEWFELDPEALARLSGPERQKAEEILRTLEVTKKRSPLSFYKPHLKQQTFHSFTAPTKCFFGGNQSGKAQPLSEPVLTPNGWSPIGSLEVGDEVIAGDGSVTPVIGVYPQGELDVFRLTFDDGAQTLCSEDHLWRVKDAESRFRKTSSRYGQWSTMSLREIRRWGDWPTAKQRVAIPVCAPDLAHRELPLDPYLLGALLGDGGLTGESVRFTSADEEILSAVASALPVGVSVKHLSRYDYGLTTGNQGGVPNPLIDALRDLGLMGLGSHDKFIPDQYLHASPEQRLALLQGLMDTDGSVSEAGHMEYGSVSVELAKGIVALVRSLGGKAKLVQRPIGYRVHIRLPLLPAFGLKRKQERCFAPISTCDERVLYSIEPAGSAECVCIKVAHPEETYVTSDYIVTHNTTGGLADDVIQAVDLEAIPPHLRPYKKFKAPFLCRIMAESYPVLETTLIEKLKDLLPVDQLVGDSWKSAYERDLRVLHFKNGSKFFFMTYQTDVSAMGGATIDRVHFDEEPPLPVFNECRMRVAVRKGDLLFTMTPTNGLTWTYDALWQRRGEQVQKDIYRAPTIDVVTVDMSDNPSMTADRIEESLRGMSKEEARARKEGRFVALHGLIYGEFEKDKHVIDCPGHPEDEPKPNWLPENVNVVVGIDPGLRHPAGVVWAYLDSEDSLVVFHEGRYEGLTAREVAGEIHKVNTAYGIFPLYYVIDPAARNKNHETGRSLQMEYADNGIVTVAGQNDVRAGINRVRERFQKDTLHIRSNCTNLIDELLRYRWKKPPRSGELTREAPVKLGDDLVDALRYLVMSRPYAPEPVIKPDETRVQRLMREHQEGFSRPNEDNYGQFGGIAP